MVFRFDVYEYDWLDKDGNLSVKYEVRQRDADNHTGYGWHGYYGFDTIEEAIEYANTRNKVELILAKNKEAIKRGRLRND